MEPLEIFQNSEINNILRYEATCKTIYEEFIKESKIKVSFPESMVYRERLLLIKDYYLENDELFNLFYKLLEKYHYRFEYDVLDLAYDVANRKKFISPDWIIKKYLRSPVIDDVFVDKHCIIINSKFGKITFFLAEDFFKDTFLVSKYLRRKSIKGRCHDNTYFLSNALRELSSIGSLCVGRLGDPFHHSYTYDEKNGLIIDLCLRSLIRKEDFDRLYLPNEVIWVNNKNVDRLLRRVDKKMSLEELCCFLRLVLYKEYLDYNHIEDKVFERSLRR